MRSEIEPLTYGDVTLYTAFAVWAADEHLLLLQPICAILVKYCVLWEKSWVIESSFLQVLRHYRWNQVSPSYAWQAVSRSSLLFYFSLITAILTLSEAYRWITCPLILFVPYKMQRYPKTHRNDWSVSTQIAQWWNSELFRHHFYKFWGIAIFCKESSSSDGQVIYSWTLYDLSLAVINK